MTDSERPPVEYASARLTLPDALPALALLGAVERLSTALALHARDDVLRAAVDIGLLEGGPGLAQYEAARLAVRYEDLYSEAIAAIRRLETLVAHLA